MSPLQPMIWSIIIIGWVIAARWIIARPPGPVLSRHAENMSRAADHMWETGDCTVCQRRAFDHDDDCALHIWLGGDQ